LLYRAEVRTEFPGYSGSGYVYLINRAGAWIEVVFRRDTASSDTITVFFSNGSGSARTLSVSLNETILGNLSFPNTSGWNNWSSIKYVVPFQAGVNRLRLTTIGTSTNPYIDKIHVAGENATPLFKLNLLSSGSGNVISNPDEIYFEPGTPITLTATPSSNNVFTRWFGSFESYSNPHTFAMNSHKTVIGIFMPENTISPFPYHQYPIGFASLNALGNNGTTGGEGGLTAIVYNGADLWNIMLDRQDPNNNRNLPPLTVYVVGILSPDPAIFGSSKMLDVKDAYDISIIGVGSDATITGFGLKIFRAKNVIVRNITFASCPDDGISIDANDDPALGHHIWVDHCTFTEIPPAGYPSFSSYDGALDITHTASFVTVSWNLFTNYDKNSLVGHSNTQVTDTAMYLTYHHNYFDSTRQRNPRVRFANVHIFNNYYRNNALYGVSSNMGAEVMVEGNYFENVPIPTETSRDGSPPGFLVERNNIFINCGVPGTGGSVFEPSIYYNYSMNIAADVPGLVQLYSGSGLYDFSRTIHDPIPVELNSFTADVNGTDVTLSWTTASEINNRGFEIQKKVNSLPAGQADLQSTVSNEEWNVIGFISGHGTTTDFKSYSFKDAGLSSGKYSYRLKQTDFDGSFTYSTIIEIDINIVREFSLSQNYPNPFNPSTIIKYQIPEKSNVTIKVFDVLGNLVQTLIDEFKEPGLYELQFDGRNLSSGVYFYQLKSGKFIQTNKMILIK
jgi:pectate lyase